MDLNEALEIAHEGNTGWGVVDNSLSTLATAIERVRALHRPVAVKFAGGRVSTVCDHCNTGDPYVTVSMDYPCPTLEALGLVA
jgi:hypothetical protein